MHSTIEKRLLTKALPYHLKFKSTVKEDEKWVIDNVIEFKTNQKLHHKDSSWFFRIN